MEKLLTDEQVKNIEYFRPDENSEEIKEKKKVGKLAFLLVI